MATASAEFHENFWGPDNKGFDVLLQNLKAGMNASKELSDFVKERMVVEDMYVKGLSKMQKSVQHISEATLGTFGPLWEVLKTMCDKLVNVHTQYVKMLTDLSREIMEYNHTQKERFKPNMRGDIEQAQEALVAYQATESSMERSKKHYLNSAAEAIKTRVKLEKLKVEASSNPKVKPRLAEAEVKMKQSQAWMDTQKSEHQTVVQKQCELLMEFQGKFSLACMKFESLEEEHMAQMVTFMIKIARTQDTTHTSMAEIFSILNSELDTWTVQKLLKEFVANKGTGKDKPTPQKFRDADPEASLHIASTKPQLSRSTEDLSTTEKHAKHERKTTFRPFKKKVKNSASITTNGPTAEPPIPEGNPVDDDGYSIRPDDPWGKKEKSDSDSDFDDDEEPANKIKNIKILEKSSAQPAATIDDLKASVKALKLGPVSPTGLRKASSSQSLNILTSSSTSSSTANTSQKISNTSGTAEGKQDQDKPQPSLLDLDTLLMSDTGISQMPTPLKPTSSTTSKPPHIAAPLLPSPQLGIRGTGSTNSGGSGPLIATTSFNNKPLDPSASLPVWSISSPTPTSSSSSILTPFSVNSASPILNPGSGSSAVASPVTSTAASASVSAAASPNLMDATPPTDPIVSRPRSNSLKSEDSGLNSIPAPPLPTKKRNAGTVRGNVSGTRAGNVATNVPTPQTPPLQPVLLSNGQDSLNSSPISRPHNRSIGQAQASPLASATPPATPLSMGGSIPLTSSDTSLMNSSVSPLVSSQTGSAVNSNAEPNSQEPIPLAVAVIDTCNAFFKGVDLSSCVVKVSGEVAMSFPSTSLSKILPSVPLKFKVDRKGAELERLLHNQHVLKKTEEDYVYSFDMIALKDYLDKLKEKDSTKSYYVIQVLKYDLKITGGGSKMPLQLKSYMKCEPATTSFRLDYSYQPTGLSAVPKKPSLTKVAFTLPMDGGVQNVMSKPNGSWSAEKGTMTWMVGDLTPADSPVTNQIQAKFSLSGGPSQFSKATATFECEGASLSGLSVDLYGSAYKMFLVKERCTAGKYISEPSKI